MIYYVRLKYSVLIWGVGVGDGLCLVLGIFVPSMSLTFQHGVIASSSNIFHKASSHTSTSKAQYHLSSESS